MAGDLEATADVLLADVDLPEGAERDAGIVLAGVAITRCGDPETAREPLAEVLEALGILPYNSAPGRYSYGRRLET